MRVLPGRVLSVLTVPGLRAPRRPWPWATGVGLAAVIISLAGSWIPSYWSDEVATLRAARLSWGDLFAFLQHKDAVHTTYYSVMKLWIGVFGESELATRSLSALAVGVAAAGLVVLVASRDVLRTGVVAGIIFSVLPRTTYLGIESRSFALSAAVAVWATVILLIAARRRTWPWWTAYAAASAVATYVFLDSVLLLAAHGLFLLLRPRLRMLWVAWLIAAGGAVVACIPVIVISVQQKEQIAWLADQPVVNAWTILVEPVFDSSWLVAAMAWVAIIVLIVRHRPRTDLVSLGAAWAVVPPILLLAADAAIGPLYAARYLSFTVPGVAILLAVAVTRWPRRIVMLALIGALVLAGLPTYLGQRTPIAKNGGSDLAQIADYIRAEAARGDAIYLQDTGSVTLRPRQALYAYPDAFRHVVDVAFEAPFTATGTFSDQTTAFDRIQPELADVDRIWVVLGGASVSNAEAVLQPAGFAEVSSHATNRSVIALYERH
ncbi:glycosyltransferase family 39 protein [Cryobacterium aureum]|uniref:glycosyltransferase family 39 protein n=1 Tax=Cryobacterium aureum TaxID=995037 RepID=UPI000CF404F5|nr:glycosyltransferase family 39 protein [Cryobacterium aureum]